MIIMTGTIRENVQIAQMSKWIEKKKEKGFLKEENFTEEERMIDFYKAQLEQNRQADKKNGISAKIQSGGTLTSEEIKYLEQNNPQLLQDYREIQQEKKGYERQLRSCKTKEEVERLKVNKLNGYLVEARSISNNPNIPKSAKKAALEKIVAKLTNIQKAHYKFVKSSEYEKLAEEDEIAKKRAELASDRQEAETEMIKEAGEKEKEVVEDIQEDQEIPVDGKVIPEGKTEPADVDAETALTYIQAALTKLEEHSYNSGGDAVVADWEYKAGKRIDMKG